MIILPLVAGNEYPAYVAQLIECELLSQLLHRF